MRVVVQNLFGRRADWPERRAVLAQGLEELQPDLVAFPEAIVTSDYDQVADLLGTDFHIAHQQEREPGDGADVEAGQGHSVASRWPLKRTWERGVYMGVDSTNPDAVKRHRPQGGPTATGAI